MTETKQTLAARLASIAKDIGWIEKGGTNDAQKYKFVQESDVVAKLKPALAEAGVIVVPTHRLISVVPFTTARGSQQFLTTIESTFSFTDGAEFINVQTIGQGADTGDKGVYKAMTGAKKYALLQAFLLATGDDPEIARDDERSETAKRSQKPAVSNDAKQADSGNSKDGIETKKKRVFALRDDLGWDNKKLGELRFSLTKKHNSGQMTSEDYDKVIEALVQLADIAKVSGGTVE